MTDFYNISEDSVQEDKPKPKPKPKQKEKFCKDKFWMDNKLELEIPYTKELEVSAYELLVGLGDSFKFNDTSQNLPNKQVALVDTRPSIFLDNPDRERLFAHANEVIKDDKELAKLEKKRRKERIADFHTWILDYLDSLSYEQICDHRWNIPEYVSPYDPRKRRIKKPEGLKCTFQII